MIFGLLQVALGVLLLACAGALGGPAWALAWPGASVLIVGLAYLRGAHGVFGKRPRDGALGGLRALALLPYVCVAWVLWQLKSLRGEAAYDEVAPGVFVGRRPRSVGEVPPGEYVAVDLTSELPRAAPTRGAAAYRCVPTLDTAPPPDEALAALVEALRAEPRAVYFHCAMGHGRSATAAAALMIARGEARDLEDAIARLKAARPRVHLHGAQRAAVERFAATLEGHDAAKDRPDRAPDPA